MSSVTDADMESRNEGENRNKEHLAETEAKMDGLLAAMGVDTSDEAKARRRRDAEALNTAEICGECGEALGADATVYKLRFLRRVMFGSGYSTRVLCEGCARRPPKPESLRFWHSVSQLREGGMSIEDAYREAIARDLLYHYCDTCERKVVWDKSKRDLYGQRKHVFCSRRCERNYYDRQRKERRAQAREKVCRICGEEFTGTRRDAKTCSSACRQEAYRLRKAGQLVED